MLHCNALLTAADVLPQEVRLTEGPPVAAAKQSSAVNMMALQRSSGHLQFMDLASSKTFVQVRFMKWLTIKMGGMRSSVLDL